MDRPPSRMPARWRASFALLPLRSSERRMVEGARFELARPLRTHQFSRLALSTAQPPLPGCRHVGTIRELRGAGGTTGVIAGWSRVKRTPIPGRGQVGSLLRSIPYSRTGFARPPACSPLLHEHVHPIQRTQPPPHFLAPRPPPRRRLRRLVRPRRPRRRTDRDLGPLSAVLLDGLRRRRPALPRPRPQLRLAAAPRRPRRRTPVGRLRTPLPPRQRRREPLWSRPSTETR